jgi:serine/threonine protein kinase
MVYQDSLIGRQIANYRIEKLLGRGGMASVYYGIDINLHRPAALKVIDDRFKHDSAFSARFLKEARAMANWRHPNIPQIYQSGVENGFNFYAMEYIHGMDLEKLLIVFSDQRDVLTFNDILQIGRAVSSALDYAHRNGAVHRDVKPANIMISDDDRIMLTDFGLVLEIDKGTRGEVFGSPHYIAPEQAKNSAEAVSQSDLYSLGVILYEMLVGQVPFEDESPASIALKHITDAPPPPRQLNPGLCPEIEQVLLKALEKLPEERYKTGQELMDALEKAFLSQESYGDTIARGAYPPSDSQTITGTARTQPRPTIAQLRAADIIARDLPPAPNTLASLENASPPPTQAFIPSSSKDSSGPPMLRRIPLTGPCSIAAILFFCVFLGVGTAFASRWVNGLQVRPTQTSHSGAAPGIGVSATEEIPNAGKTSTASLELTRTFTAGVLTQTRLPTHTPSITTNPTRTSSPTITSSPTMTPSLTMTASPTLTSSRTATPYTNYHLVIVKQKEEGIFIVNEGQTIIPIEFLEFRKDRFVFSGEEWEIDELKPGECTVVWSADGRVNLPRNQECNQVGELIRKSAKDKFWTSDFSVYYNEVRIDVCKKNKNCEFEFRGTP